MIFVVDAPQSEKSYPINVTAVDGWMAGDKRLMEKRRYCMTRYTLIGDGRRELVVVLKFAWLT